MQGRFRRLTSTPGTNGPCNMQKQIGTFLAANGMNDVTTNWLSASRFKMAIHMGKKCEHRTAPPQRNLTVSTLWNPETPSCR